MDELETQGDLLDGTKGDIAFESRSIDPEPAAIEPIDAVLDQSAPSVQDEVVVLLDPWACTISKANGRCGVTFDPAKNAELVEDIRRQGQQTPVIVRQAADGGYELVAGTRRLGAIRELRKHQPGLMVRAYLRTLTDQEAWQIADAENAGRRDLTTLQRARSWQYAVETFHDGRQDLFANATGRDPSVVSRTLALLSLPKEVLGALRDPEAVSVNFAAKLAPALADDVKRARILKIAANAIEKGGDLSGPVLLKRLLLSPEEIAASEPASIRMGDWEKQAAFVRSEKGGATLTIRPVPNSTDEKTKRAFLREMESQLRSFLQL